MDFSSIVIQEMKRKNSNRPKMKWDVMDITKMTYNSESFDLVLDKGALDAIASENTLSVMNQITLMMSEISRVLCKNTEKTRKGNGIYICISLAQNYILQKLIHEFHDNWSIELSQIIPSDQTSSLIPFCFLFEKVSSGKTSKILSKCDSIKGEISFDQMIQMISEIQWMNAARVEFSSIHRGNRMVLHLHGLDESDIPRFTIYLIDSPLKTAPNGKCCVFIVPQGREHEWLFSSPEGQMELVTTHIGFQRVLLVHLGRSQQFSDGLDGVQNELSGKVKSHFFKT